MIKCYSCSASGNGSYVLRLVNSRRWGSPVPLIVQFHLLNFGLICDGGVLVVGFTVGLILIWSDSVSWMLLYLVFVFMGCVWFLRKCKESWRKFFNSPFHFI